MDGFWWEILCYGFVNEGVGDAEDLIYLGCIDFGDMGSEFALGAINLFSMYDGSPRPCREQNLVFFRSRASYIKLLFSLVLNMVGDYNSIAV